MNNFIHAVTNVQVWLRSMTQRSKTRATAGVLWGPLVGQETPCWIPSAASGEGVPRSTACRAPYGDSHIVGGPRWRRAKDPQWRLPNLESIRRAPWSRVEPRRGHPTGRYRGSPLRKGRRWDGCTACGARLPDAAESEKKTDRKFPLVVITDAAFSSTRLGSWGDHVTGHRLCRGGRDCWGSAEEGSGWWLGSLSCFGCLVQG